ncbi:MAG TPA: SMP-30/gluconolactonase/LRE family protein [Aliidongia sp.]|nr:SMP-30/gluconolactonase/LRE family protein [Aliidongia sp.]
MTLQSLTHLLLTIMVCLSGIMGAPAARAADVEIVARNLGFIEGTIFVGDTLYFVDYSTSKVLRLVDGKVETVWHQDGCGANGLVQVPAGLLVACFDGGTVEQISLAGNSVRTISHDGAGNPLVAPNDLATDAKGGVYFSASGTEGRVPGKVFYPSAGGSVREVASEMHFSNGLVVSLDGKRLYVAESRARRLLTFAITADGTLSDRQEFVKLGDVLAEGARRLYSPDGVRMDRHGNIFIGLYEGGGLAVLSPDGKLVAQVDLPAAHHANLAIAPDGKSIYVTAVDDGPGGSYRGEICRVPNPVAE